MLLTALLVFVIFMLVAEKHTGSCCIEPGGIGLAPFIVYLSVGKPIFLASLLRPLSSLASCLPNFHHLITLSSETSNITKAIQYTLTTFSPTLLPQTIHSHQRHEHTGIFWTGGSLNQAR